MIRFNFVLYGSSHIWQNLSILDVNLLTDRRYVRVLWGDQLSCIGTPECRTLYDTPGRGVFVVTANQKLPTWLASTIILLADVHSHSAAHTYKLNFALPPPPNPPLQ